MVTEDQIQAILETEPDPQARADRLIKAANRAGGIDNITVVSCSRGCDRRGTAVRGVPTRGAEPRSGEHRDVGERRRAPRLAPWKWVGRLVRRWSALAVSSRPASTSIASGTSA